MATKQNDRVIDIRRAATPGKLPENLGKLLDIRWQLKLQKDAVNKALAEIEKDIALVEDAIFLRLGKEGDLGGVRGKLCQASITTVEYPVVDDWDATLGYIKKGRGTTRFSLLQKRLSVTALREYWADDRAVPGVNRAEKRRLSLTRVK